MMITLSPLSLTVAFSLTDLHLLHIGLHLANGIGGADELVVVVMNQHLHVIVERLDLRNKTGIMLSEKPADRETKSAEREEVNIALTDR